MKNSSQRQFIAKRYGVTPAALLHWLKRHDLNETKQEPDIKPKLKRTKKPTGRFTVNQHAEDLYRLKFAARELDKKLGMDPPINLTSTREQLIS